MEEIRISARLDRLALRYDYTIVCKDIRTVGNKVELTDPIEYTKEELLERYDGDKRIYRWVDTYTENKEPAMAVVIEEE